MYAYYQVQAELIYDSPISLGMVRIVQTGFSDDEWLKISNWLTRHDGMTIYELLKRAALEYIDRYQGDDKPDLPKQIELLIGDLKRFSRHNFDHRANVRWLKGRHGVTEGTANEALRIFEAEIMTL